MAAQVSRVGAVRRQLVGVAEGLVACREPVPAGDVGLRRHHAVPQPLHRRAAARASPVSTATSATPAAAGTAARTAWPVDLGRLADRHVVLAVLRAHRRAEQAVAAPLDEARGQRRGSARSPGLPVQLHQRGLDLGVAVEAVAAVRAEPLDEVVGEPARHVEQPRVARGPRAAATAAWMRWPAQYSSWLQRRSWQRSPVRRSLEPRVEVAVGLLGRGEQRGASSRTPAARGRRRGPSPSRRPRAPCRRPSRRTTCRGTAPPPGRRGGGSCRGCPRTRGWRCSGRSSRRG